MNARVNPLWILEQPNSTGNEIIAACAQVAELVAAAKRADELVRLLTVRQVIEAGDTAIDAAGLNPYCINEGLADGSEGIGFWHLTAALAPFTEPTA